MDRIMTLRPGFKKGEHPRKQARALRRDVNILINYVLFLQAIPLMVG